MTRRMTKSSPTGNWKNLLGITGLGILGLLSLFLYLKAKWPTLDQFIQAVDQCEIFFCDFVQHYYPMGREVLGAYKPVPGFFYSAFFAILLFPLGVLSLGSAMAVWGILQGTGAVILGLLSAKYFLRASSLGTVLFFFLFLSSFPLFHNFKWGQVSVFITLGILGALIAFQRGFPALGGFLLALVVSIKYYPALFLVPFLVRPNKRFLISFGFSTVVFLFLFPSVFLGAGQALRLQLACWHGVFPAPDWVHFNLNSQFLAHVLMRWFGQEGSNIRIILKWTGLLVFLVHLWLVWKARGMEIKDWLTISFLLIFLSLPLVIETSWPHYFVYLPICQAIVLSCGTGHLKGHKHLATMAVGLASTSIALSSIFVFHLFPNWMIYNYFGILFLSNTLLLLALYGMLSLELKKVRELRVVTDPIVGR